MRSLTRIFEVLMLAVVFALFRSSVEFRIQSLEQSKTPAAASWPEPRSQRPTRLKVSAKPS